MTPKPQTIPIEKLRYSKAEFAKAMGISMQTVQNRINAGQLQIVRDGKRVFITRHAALEYATKNQRGWTLKKRTTWAQKRAAKAKQRQPRGSRLEATAQPGETPRRPATRPTQRQQD